MPAIAMLLAGTGNSIWVFPVGECEQEAGWEAEVRFEPGTLILDTGIRRGTLTTMSSSGPVLKYFLLSLNSC